VQRFAADGLPVSIAGGDATSYLSSYAGYRAKRRKNVSGRRPFSRVAALLQM
jgi:hypothetical protein